MSDVRVKPPHVQEDVGGPGLGETDPERPGGGSGGRAQRGLASSPAAIQWGAGAAGTSLRAGAALPQPSPRARGRGAGGTERHPSPRGHSPAAARPALQRPAGPRPPSSG